MNYRLQLQEINNKYYDKIKNAYGRYIKNFDNIPDMTKDIVFLSDNQCVGNYEDLKFNRGKCDTDTGIIYIHENKFNEHVLVHEFIHRLSRNKVKIGLFKKQWIEGIMFVDKKVALHGLNEVLTEYFAYQITNYKENNTYQIQFSFIKEIQKYPNLLDKITAVYFNNDYLKLLELLYDLYGMLAYEKVNKLDRCVRDGNIFS